jgi:hypothetical protein
MGEEISESANVHMSVREVFLSVRELGLYFRLDSFLTSHKPAIPVRWPSSYPRAWLHKFALDVQIQYLQTVYDRLLPSTWQRTGYNEWRYPSGINKRVVRSSCWFGRRFCFCCCFPMTMMFNSPRNRRGNAMIYLLRTSVILKVAVFWVVAPCNPDDGGSKCLWNVGKLLLDYTALQPRRPVFILAAVRTSNPTAIRLVYKCVLLYNP